MIEEKKTILIVEDDPDVANMLGAHFAALGYGVQSHSHGAVALDFCRLSPPDLAILDIHLPDVDGFEVARSLHAEVQTMGIPIIFLTERLEHLQQLQWLDLGTDDYMAKPFDILELTRRVSEILDRSGPKAGVNPVTGLPEGDQVDDRLAEWLGSAGQSILCIRLDNLEAFSNTYGLTAANNALKALGRIVLVTTRESAGDSFFLAHLSRNILMLITDSAHQEQLAMKIRLRLEASLVYFYPIKDREHKNRMGKQLAVRVKALDLNPGEIASAGELRQALLAY